MKTTMEVFVKYNDKIFTGNADLTHKKPKKNYALKKQVHIGKYSFHAETHRLQVGNTIYRLTNRENQILETLSNHLGRIVERSFLLISFWGNQTTYTSRSLDVFIHSLRQYLSQDKNVNIETVRGRGLILNVL